MTTPHTVGGTVAGTDNSPAAGLDIVVVDADLDIDDPQGHAETGGDGRFRLEFPADEHGDLDGRPELYANAFEDGGRGQQ